MKVTAFVVIFTLLVFTLIFLSQQNNSQRQREALFSLEHLYQQNISLKQIKDNFIYRDTRLEQLYKFGYSNSTIKHDSLIRICKENLKQIGNQYSYDQLDLIGQHLSTYNKKFYGVKELVQKRGFKDFGLEGELRAKIHAVESTVEQYKDYRLKSHMLMLRRHEKDYIIRKDMAYLDKFNNELQQTLAYLNPNSQTNLKTITLLNEYGKLFNNYVKLDKEIGDENSGALSELNRISEELASKINEARTELTKKINTTANRVYLNMLALIVIVSLLTLYIITKVGKHITKNLKLIQKVLGKMGKGEIPEPIKVQGKDEISGIELSINDLTTALRNTRDFAIQVGNGNFYSEVNVFGNTGELGTKLLEMRKKLMEVANERERNLRLNEQRNWLNESLAKVSDILRVKYENTSELCFQFIRFVVQKTDALQGGVFLVKGNDNDKYIELITSYALDRRKYIKKTLDIHEGLPGACIFEKDSIFITDIPKDYIHITTGLGHSNPSCILLAPLVTDMNEVLGCIEIASFKIFDRVQQEFIKKACINLASAIKFNEMITLNEQIIGEMKQKNHELQANEEELRQNMEELKTIREDMERREEELTREIQELKKVINDHEGIELVPKTIIRPLTN